MRSSRHPALSGAMCLFLAAGAGSRTLPASGLAQPEAVVPGQPAPPPLPTPEQVRTLVLGAPAAVHAWNRVLLAKAAGDAAGVDWYDPDQPTLEAGEAVLAMLRAAVGYREAVLGVLAGLQGGWLAQGHPAPACRERAQQGAELLDEAFGRRVDAMLDPPVAG